MRKISRISFHGFNLRLHLLKHERDRFAPFTGIDTRRQSIVSLAVDDPLRKVVLRVLEDCFGGRSAGEFEISAGTARLRMRDVINPIRALFNPQVFEFNRLITRNSATHPEHRLTRHRGPVLLNLSSSSGLALPMAGDPRDVRERGSLSEYDREQTSFKHHV